MYAKAFIINVNKRLKPFFLEQHITIVNKVTLQSFWFIFTICTMVCAYERGENQQTFANHPHHCRQIFRALERI